MIQPNQILIATDVLQDSNFANASIFIENVDSINGTDGWILNGKKVGFCCFGSFESAHFEDYDVESYEEDDEESGDNSRHDFEKMVEMFRSMNKVPISQGGNCNNELFMVHSHPDVTGEMTISEKEAMNIPIMEDALVSSDIIPDSLYFGYPPSLVRIVEDYSPEEWQFRFFIGKVEWFPGQLEDEIKNGAWEVRDYDPELFFKVPRKKAGQSKWYEKFRD